MRTALGRALVAWYERHRRSLPWRRDKDPYRVWVAEVMLQQTTVKTAVPYYEAFLERFPTSTALADAPEDAVLAAWSGLGYYQRARNLQKAARHVRDRHAGQFPRSLEAALAVPGIGLYAASAILSIAYDQPLPVVDGNVRRVLARLLVLRGAEYKRDAAFYNQAEELLDRERPGEWNQALMELGATVCLPRKPACDACPLRPHCKGFARGLVDELPEARARKNAVQVTVAAAIVERDGRFLLVRRSAGRAMDRLWELPQTSLTSRGLGDLVPELAERHGLHVAAGALVVRARHTITFHRITLEGYRAGLTSREPGDADRVRWASREEIARIGVSAATRKLLRGLDRAQLPLGI